MRYIKFSGNTGYVGTHYEEYEAFDSEASDNEIEDISYFLGQKNGEMYEYLATQGVDEEDYCGIDEALEDYWSQVEDSWEEVSKEEYLENVE